tara:strand:+ start:2287 stop:3132 length:846 start_codon:yes stop_codon:yes gene_type:complete
MFFIAFISLVFAKMEVQGHRGARSIHPENTLKAMRYALEVGVDTLEMDLGVTKDNVLVLSHDPILNAEICRTNQGKKLSEPVVIRSLTFQELQKYNCASVKNPNFPKQVPDAAESIPKLEDVFKLVQKSKLPAAKKVEFNIETKMSPDHPELSPSPEKFAQLIIDMAKKHKLLDRIIIQSFDHRSLKAAKKIEAKVRVAALTGKVYPPNLLEVLRDIPADIWSPNYKTLNQTTVTRVQKAGIRVIPWTANTKESWDKLVNLGVDGIITDDPAALQQFLKRD